MILHLSSGEFMHYTELLFLHPIDDLNQDGIPEILAVHGGDELSDPALEEKMFGRLIIFDGQNGTIYKWMQTPDR